MANQTIPSGLPTPLKTQNAQVQVIRHQQVCEKLQLSSAKLFAMCAEGVFPKPFQIIPGGRAVGWLSSDVDAWIMQRSKLGGAQ